MTSPLRSIAFVLGPKARKMEVATHNLTIPPTHLGKRSVTQLQPLQIGLYGYRTKPELASLMRPFTPGEDSCLRQEASYNPIRTLNDERMRRRILPFLSIPNTVKQHEFVIVRVLSFFIIFV